MPNKHTEVIQYLSRLFATALQRAALMVNRNADRDENLWQPFLLSGVASITAAG